MIRARRAAVTALLTTVLTAGAVAATAGSASAADTAPHTVGVQGPQALFCGYDNRGVPPTIRQGSTGAPVQEAQCLLRYWGFNPGNIDGIFGPNTRSAVVAFQQWVGLTADGIVGPQTWFWLRNG